MMYPTAAVRREGDQVNLDLRIAPNVLALFCWTPSEGWTAWGWDTDGQIIGQAMADPPRVPAGSLQKLLSHVAGYPERNAA